MRAPQQPPSSFILPGVVVLWFSLKKLDHFSSTRWYNRGNGFIKLNYVYKAFDPTVFYFWDWLRSQLFNGYRFRTLLSVAARGVQWHRGGRGAFTFPAFGRSIYPLPNKIYTCPLDFQTFRRLWRGVRSSALVKNWNAKLQAVQYVCKLLNRAHSRFEF